MSIPLATIKNALKITYTEDDSELVRLREAAVALVERRTGVALERRTETLYLTAWVDALIPVAPFVSLASVQYTDSAGAVQTMPAADYWIDRSDGPNPILRFLAMPARKEGTAITVTYTAGHLALPNEIAHCCIALVGAWYNNPEAFQNVGLTVVPLSVEFILETIDARSPMR
mgnify:CR=1 FL=1